MLKKPVFRFSAFFLAFIVFMNGMGIFVLAFVHIGLHRVSDAREESAEAVQLQLTTSDYRNVVWIGERDFVYDGKVYDADSVRQSGGKVEINCHQDEEETSVRETVSSNLDGKEKNNTDAFRNIFKIAHGLDEMVVLQVNSGNAPVAIVGHPQYLNSQSSVVLSLNAPPPKAA